MRIWRISVYMALVLLAQTVLAVDLQGVLAQGGLMIGRVQPGAAAFLDGQALKVSGDGTFVFGFGRDAAPSAELTICHQGQCSSQKLEIRQRQYEIQRVDGVPQETVTPPPEVLGRIRKEGAMVAAARRIVSDSESFAEPFIWPLQGPITGVFGSQRVYNGEPRRPHFGVDVAAPTGTLVVAPADATVTLVHPDMYFSGGTLVMDHGFGVSSTFIHMSKVLVKEGQKVKQGEVVGAVGATGRATGPHLDWRMNWFAARLDPELHVGPMAKKGAPEKRMPDSTDDDTDQVSSNGQSN